MKHKRTIASILIVALVIVCAASLFAVWQGAQIFRASGVRFALGPNTLSATATEEKTLSVSGTPQLTVTNDLGDVIVKGGGLEGQVSISAEKTAWAENQTQAEAALEDIRVIIEQTGDDIEVSVQQPAVVKVFGAEKAPGRVNFVIVVPQETSVSLRSMNGDLGLNGITGDASLATEFGGIGVANLRGRLEANTINGDITAQGINSAPEITLTSEFGGATLTSATAGSVLVSTTNGRIEIANVRSEGPLEAHSDFGNIHVGDASGASGEFRSNNGEVQLERLSIDGTVRVENGFGNISLTGVEADGYDLNSQNGKISVDGAQGPIKIHSDFGSVEVLNARDATLDLSSNKGGVTFSGSLGEGPHTLISEFGSVKLTLPADSALTVDLQTNFGKITSDFDIAIHGEVDSQHWQGTINGGEILLTANTDNGNITLISSK
jgi:DUF4097 and DUF4098 domain-containing protein YvlB